MLTLRNNQLKAINASINNNFESGTHFQVTGAGKSWIALKIVLEYLERNPTNSNVLWICEQKSILIEQFNKDTIKHRGFNDIFNKFLIYDFTVKKPENWYSNINSGIFWNKPILIIINRAFLTSNEKYKLLRLPLHLIIHDECHSISNKTTKTFYEYIQIKYPLIKCIGFSATPNLELQPYNKIISQYNIYDAFVDDIIVAPKIVWLKRNTPIKQIDIRRILKKYINDMPYKKIIIWCGIIDLCYSAALEWSSDEYFKDWLIAIDTSQNDDSSKNTYSKYEEFREIKQKGILFCAAKHREGSDIPNLDTCVFLDGVEDRGAKTFVQCIGRVLRTDKDAKKKYGLIIDVSASSSIKICNRINEYLNNDSKIFPFRYQSKIDEDITINELNMIKVIDSSISNLELITNAKTDIQTYFIRKIPEQSNYQNRLDHEIQLLIDKNLTGYLLQAIDILNITKNIPHVTRGSCGSSLVCYLLGISHVDPVKWNISFARFLTEYRNNLPDIDFDFPYNMRDEVFLQINIRWTGKVARISNHVYYHEKSALREAIRRVGVHKMIPTLELYNTINSLNNDEQEFIKKESKKLIDTFRTYSLHCGGIVFYPDGIPSDIKLENNNTVISQIVLNKHDVAKYQNFKIDILSSRGLAQLFEANQFKPINFDTDNSILEDKQTSELFMNGHNIGITFAESPLMRKALMKVKPKNIHEVAICLAMIRPAAKEARDSDDSIDLNSMFIFDDDAIKMISEYLGCSEADADRFRRGITKNDKDIVNEFNDKLKYINPSKSQELQTKLKNLIKYSFCKSHAYSYALLVWQLGYMKVHYPYQFWKSTLKHCSSQYRRWVHLYEARLAGVEINEFSQPHKSIYALARKSNQNKKIDTFAESLRINGIWSYDSLDFYPNCYIRESDQPNKLRIRGIIANSRTLSYSKNKKKSVILFVGYAPHKFVEIIVISDYLSRLSEKIGITCRAAVKDTLSFETYDKDFVLW